MMLNVLSIFAGFVFPLLPVYARDIFEVGELGYGIMMTVFGLGGLTGTIGLAMAGDVKRKGIMLIAPGVVWLFGTFVFAFSNSYYLSVAVLGVMGAAGILYVTTINAMVQMAVPDELRGRVSSLLSITMQLFPIGFFASGIIAQTISNEVALMTSGIGVMAPVVMVFAVSPSFRALTLGDSG
jgi:MFS family permease